MEKAEIYRILNEAYFSQDCEEKDTLTALLPTFIKKKCFVDIGASLGQYTRFANHHMTNGEIYAIEADPVRFEELKRNCELWEQTSTNRIYPIHAAVSDSDGSISFYTTNSNTSGGLFKHPVKGDGVEWEEISVSAVTLDALLEGKKPDFLKMDVEGAELRALRGARRILEEGTELFVEVHSWTDPAGQKNAEEVYAYMEQLGYRAKKIGGRPLFSRAAPAAKKSNGKTTPARNPQPSRLDALRQLKQELSDSVFPASDADPVTRYHQPLFSKSEQVLYRLAAQRNQIPEFYRWYERLHRPIPDVAKFKDLHRGERCFIMGGGPSLKQCDPAPLSSEFTFGVNGIFLVYEWLGFEPTYYCVEDWLVYEDRAKDIVQRVNRSQCFFPRQFSKPGFDRPNHHYYRGLYEFHPTPDWPNFSEDASKLLWIGGTVTYICIQLAFHMGFQNVYLIGMDHSYTKPEHVATSGNRWTAHGDDPNHFHPDYFGKGYRCHDPRTDRMEKAYAKAKRVFRENGRDIYNATIGGKLEVFPRVDYASLF